MRAMTAGVAYADADHLLRWCLTVARHAHIDLHRRGRNNDLELDRDVAHHEDVHARVAARLDLDAVRQVWPRLSTRDRQLLAESASEVVREQVSRTEAVRLNVARHRARQRLRALLMAALGLFGASVRCARRAIGPLGASLVVAALVTALPVEARPAVPRPALPAPVAAAPSLHAPGQTRTRTGRAADDAITTSQRVVRRPAAPRSPAGAPAARTPEGAPASLGLVIKGHQRPSGSGNGLTLCVGGLVLVPDICVAAGEGRPSMALPSATS